MSKKKSKGPIILIAILFWGALISGGLWWWHQYGGGKKLLNSMIEKSTGSESSYKHKINIALDSFSGYSILRSKAFKNQLRSEGIKLDLNDDGANYENRMEAIEDGDVDMAVIPLNSLIEYVVKKGKSPATAILVIDETCGADAIVAYKNAVPNITALNSDTAKLVATPGSPSEFLGRIVTATFNLPNLPEKWLQEEDGAEKVYNEMKTADNKLKRAYILWEPYVSKALENKDVHILLDSSKLKGYILDVLIVNRKFLKNNHDLVKTVVKAYLSTSFSYSSTPGDMLELIKKDAADSGAALTDAQAERTTKGISWKNTLQNYQYFGIEKSDSTLEDMISNICEVLVKTRGIKWNTLDGNETSLYYNGILRELKDSNFHPGKKLNIIKGDLGLKLTDNSANEQKALVALSASQWNSLIEVGNIKIPSISFSRGTSRIGIQSKRDLRALAKRLESWPQYYLLIKGNSRAGGDLAACKKLAGDRANAVVDFLKNQGIKSERIKAKAMEPTEKGGDSQSVEFAVVQLPY